MNERTLYELSRETEERISVALAQAYIHERVGSAYELMLGKLKAEGSAHPERHVIELCRRWLSEDEPTNFKLSLASQVLEYLGDQCAQLGKFRDDVNYIIRAALSESCLRLY